MKNIIIATTHTWNIDHAHKLRTEFPNDSIHILIDKSELTVAYLQSVNPEYVFFPHWSWIIPAGVYEHFNCIVFHMTDLPFGRGGSPLQNLIARGIAETKISAIRVVKELDAGDIYLKEPLSLHGGAEEIFMRTSDIIFDKMIPYIIKNNPAPQPQKGEPVCFARRTPAMSEISADMTLSQIFDYIRMLDAEGYPNAFIKFGSYKLSFSRPKRTSRGIVADVEMEIKNDKH